MLNLINSLIKVSKFSSHTLRILFFYLIWTNWQRKFNIYTGQPGNLFLHSITIFYQACKVCHFTKHVKACHFSKNARQAIFWSTSSRPFYKPQQTGHFMKHGKHARTPTRKHVNHVKRAKHISTQTSHLTASNSVHIER